MRKKLPHIVLFFCIVQLLHSQNDGVVAFDVPARNSMKFNRFINNPTFSFVREANKYISINNKRQWTSFNDNPETYLFSFSGRMNENMGAGIGLYQQNYGVLTSFGGVLNYAYNAAFSETSNLTFGINAGFYQSSINDGNVVTNFPDPSLANIENNSLLHISPAINYGIGFLDFGVAVNNAVAYNLATSEMIEDNPEQSIQGHAMYTGYLESGGFFGDSKFSLLAISEFKPDNTIVSGLMMLSVPRGIWAQAGYNSLYGVSGGVGINITKNIAIEYNYETALGDLSGFGNSHDITLAWRFNNEQNFDYTDEEEEMALLAPSPYTSKKRKKVKASNIDANTKALADARRERIRAERLEKAKIDKDSIAKAEVLALEEAKIQEAIKAEEEKARIAEAEERRKQQEERARAQQEADLAAKRAAELKAIEDAKEAKENARLAEIERAKQQAEKERLAEIERAKQQSEKARLAEIAKAEEAERLKAEAEARALAEAAEKERLAQQETARLEAEARAKEQTELEARLAAEQKAQEEARLKKEAEERAAAEAKALAEPQDQTTKTLKTLVEKTTDRDSIQEDLLVKLQDKIDIKRQDLKDLKDENDLSEQGIYVAPKPFKSVTAENRELSSLKSQLETNIKDQDNRIKELEELYEERLELVPDELDQVNLVYKKKIEKLKASQLSAIRLKNQLETTLSEIEIATEFERKRRIKRAAYDNETDRYNKDRARLKNLLESTPLASQPIKAEDFDFGDTKADIQILKNVPNIDKGYYLVIAVHSNTAKRDEFLKQVIASGRRDVNFFYDVNTSKYYIYYEKYNQIYQAENGMKNKGNRPYNGEMSLVKIEN